MSVNGINAYRQMQRTAMPEPRERHEVEAPSAESADESRDRLLKLLEPKGRILDIRV